MTVGEGLHDHLLTITEAAKYTPYTATFLRQQARKGVLRSEKIGRDWLTTESALREFLRQQAARHQQAILALQTASEGMGA